MAESFLYDELLSRLTEETLELLEREIAMPIIVIDGRAGSGKSTLALDLQNELFRSGESMPRVIHMDDLYEGWHGLAQGVDYLQRVVISPLLATGASSWQEFNWELKTRDRWREFSGGTPLIIEGCGSLNRFTHTLAHLTVWLDVSVEIRKQRWLERDGHIFDQYFDIWAAQELDFMAREKSAELAQFGLAGSPVD
jgi:uridine kinase